MKDQKSFVEEITGGYFFSGESVFIGAALHDGKPVKEALIRIPLKTMNRHGLIAGATGTGKTKTIQRICEELSLKSVPVLMMDIKGDFSGISMPGEINEKIRLRTESIGQEFRPTGFPVEFMSISSQDGVRLRSSVSEFGPVLFSKILGLNDTQSGVVSIAFKYADDRKLGLVDLKDFKKILQHLTNDGKSEAEKEYGKISTSTTGTILRKIIELEQQGADAFFGEPSFDVNDLIRINDEGKGVINVLRLTDIQDKPKLFSTFMLSLLAEMYSTLPEEGDLDAPKLIVFIDEAHLIFEDASDALMDQLEAIIKLIRSKGVGIFFCTQNPADIPASILSQLGLKIQHALRAFTAMDRKAIKLAAQNYPETEYYNTEELLTQLGIGEAFITALSEKGTPTPLAAVMMSVPLSRMSTITDEERNSIIKASSLYKKYKETIDAETAFEILSEKINQKLEEPVKNTTAKPVSTKKEKSMIEDVLSSPVTKQVGRTIARELTRGLLGVLGLGGGRRKSKGLF